MPFSLDHSDYGLRPNLRRVHLLVLTAFFTGSLLMAAFAMAWGDTFTLWEAFAVCAASAISYILCRKGYADHALGFPLYVIAGCVFRSCYLFRGINDVSTALIPVMILVAGLLLNRRFVIFYATVVALAGIGVMAGRWWITRVAAYNPSEASDLFLFTITCALTAVISERLAAHIGENYRQIHESEERFNQLAEQGRTTVWEVDAQGLFTHVSQVSEECWGYRPDELEGRKYFYELHPENGREAYKAAVIAIIERRQPFRDLVHPMETSDGLVVWASANGIPLLSADGTTLRGYRGSCSDITARKNAEEILKASEEKYRALVETTDTGYLIADREGKVIDANREYVRLTGHADLEEILGRSLLEWSAPHQKEKSAEALARCLRDGFLRNLVVEHVDREHRVIPIEVNATVTGGGDSLRIVSLCRDITERKRAERHQSLRAEILGIFSESSGVEESLRRVLDSIKREIGADSVGLRLRDGIGFPNPVQDGLSSDFLLTGNTLAAYAGDRSAGKDSSIPLECICGAVLSGKTDAENPLFTASGSFWTNNSLSLLDLRADQDPKPHSRNGCIHEGFRSVALVPIRTDLEIHGLLQLNYYREGSLTINEVQFFEEVCSIVGVAIKRKHAEEALQQANQRLAEAEKLYREIFAGASAGIFRTSPKGNTLTANPAVAKMLGYDSPEEVVSTINDPARQVWLDPDEWSQFIRRLDDLDFVRGYECQFKRKNGSALWVSLTCRKVRDADGQVVAAEGFIDDITDRKRAVDALRESEERFRNIADNCPVIIWYSGLDRRLTFLNKQAAVFSGRDLEELLGGSWLELVHPEDLGRLVMTLATAVSNQSGIQAELRLRRHDGEYRWMLNTGVPRFLGGVYAGYMGIAADITEIKQKQEQVLAAQKFESLGVLASGIAHDFNNMLGSILAESELVLSELPAGSPVAREVRNIKVVAVRTSEIVRQLLAYVGKEGAAFAPVDLSRLVAEMLRLMKASISKAAELKTSLGGNLPAVRANAPQLRQIVMNLITNASEALAKDGGVITVSTAGVSRNLSRVAGTDATDSNYVRLEVSDTGSGMSEEVRARIFDPFFTTKREGRGLGLAAVQGIVRSHGGMIEVVSAPGQGTRMAVLLPCAGENGDEDQADAGLNLTARYDTANGTVLFVEDEETLRTPTAKMLRKQGLSILEASDGLAAVELFRAHESVIDVVLLDLTLPGMSGKDVFAEVRRIRPGVKVIITTAYSEEMAVNALGGQHDWSFIQKPYRITELAKLLRDVMTH